MSLDVIHDRAPQRSAERTLLVMLPSAKACARDFVECGFVREMRQRGLPVDVVAVEAHLGHYLDGSISERLHDDVIAPARVEKYRRIWLMGISLGGMGSLLYTRQHPADIEGLVLLAPFLGVRGTIAEVVRAGGLASWQPGAIKMDDDERHLLAWIKSFGPHTPALPKIYLGYGTKDRFAAASELLAARLPATRVTTNAGGHDWNTWLQLWQQLLDLDCFGDDKARQRPPLEQRPALG